MVGSRKTSSSPALQALLLQVVALVTVAVSSWLLNRCFGWQAGVMVAALAQGVLAAGFSRMRRMAPWWPPIQLAFPLAVVIVRTLHLPSWIFLCAFVALGVLYWTSYRTQVPYYPCGPNVRKAVCDLLAEDPSLTFVDIGSGFGGLVLQVARLLPSADCLGVELAPLPWLVSWLRAARAGGRVRFLRRDYHSLDFSRFDVVFAYLSPAAMPELWAKARGEMHSGALLLSYEFGIPEAEPDFALQPRKDSPPLFGWRF